LLLDWVCVGSSALSQIASLFGLLAAAVIALTTKAVFSAL
jgi:hypothetical protein